jgi:hypothetical protein
VALADVGNGSDMKAGVGAGASTGIVERYCAARLGLRLGQAYPAPQQVGVDTARRRYRRHRHAGLHACRYGIGFEFVAVQAPAAPAVDAD